MNTEQLIVEYIEKWACNAGLDWFTAQREKGNSIQTIWQDCPEASWMMWFIAGFDTKVGEQIQNAARDMERDATEAEYCRLVLSFVPDIVEFVDLRKPAPKKRYLVKKTIVAGTYVEATSEIEACNLAPSYIDNPEAYDIYDIETEAEEVEDEEGDA